MSVEAYLEQLVREDEEWGELAGAAITQFDPEFTDVRAAVMEAWSKRNAEKAVQQKTCLLTSARNMAYRVEFTPKVEGDLDELYSWVAQNAPYRGPLWFDRFEATILSLRNFPERCPVVEGLSTPKDIIRQLVFGRKRNRYVVYYAVFGDVVRIPHVRHSARRPQRVSKISSDEADVGDLDVRDTAMAVISFTIT